MEKMILALVAGRVRAAVVLGADDVVLGYPVNPVILWVAAPLLITSATTSKA